MAFYRTPEGGSEHLSDQIVLPEQPVQSLHPKLAEVVDENSIEKDSALLSTDSEKTAPESTTQSLTPPSALDWTGPDDPDNPHNWPTWRRVYITFSTALLGFAVYVGTLSLRPLLVSLLTML